VFLFLSSGLSDILFLLYLSFSDSLFRSFIRSFFLFLYLNFLCLCQFTGLCSGEWHDEWRGFERKRSGQFLNNITEICWRVREK
jgi:hypothetical protein